MLDDHQRYLDRGNYWTKDCEEEEMPEPQMRCPNIDRDDHAGESYYPEVHKRGDWYVWSPECPECGVVGEEV